MKDRRWKDIIWILLKTVVAFACIRILSTSVFVFGNSKKSILMATVQFTIFTYLIYKYVSGEARKNGLTLNECYTPQVTIGIKDVLFALFLVSALSFGIFIYAERIVPTNVELGSFLSLAILNFVRSGLGSGINEELVFRGYLLKVIEEKKGRIWAAALSSLTFGLAHMLNEGMAPMETLWTVIGTGSIGLMLSVLTYETGSIWRGVIIHTFINTRERFLGFDRASSLFLYEFPAGMTEEIRSCASWMVISAISWLVVLWYCWKWRKHKSL